MDKLESHGIVLTEKELGFLDEVNELADAYTNRWGWTQKIKELL